MEWSDLEVFLAAVRAGSYTAAGRHLKVNRTTVGRRVDALEQALGAPLFDYTALGPAPTAAGGRVLAAAEVIEREIAAMLADLATPGPRQPVMRIAGSAGLAGEFLPEITAFCGANPDVPVELLEELDPLDALTQRRADLAIALVRTPPLRSSACWGRRHMPSAAQTDWHHLAGASNSARPFPAGNGYRPILPATPRSRLDSSPAILGRK